MVHEDHVVVFFIGHFDTFESRFRKVNLDLGGSEEFTADDPVQIVVVYYEHLCLWSFECLLILRLFLSDDAGLVEFHVS